MWWPRELRDVLFVGGRLKSPSQAEWAFWVCVGSGGGAKSISCKQEAAWLVGSATDVVRSTATLSDIICHVPITSLCNSWILLISSTKSYLSKFVWTYDVSIWSLHEASNPRNLSLVRRLIFADRFETKLLVESAAEGVRYVASLCAHPISIVGSNWELSHLVKFFAHNEDCHFKL